MVDRDGTALAEELEAEASVEAREWQPRYNVAPTQPVPVLSQLTPKKRTLTLMSWGIRAPGRGGKPLINARCETVAERRAFSKSVERRRCIVPATGFYEWKRLGSEGRERQAHLFSRRDGQLLLLAGIWSEGPVEVGPTTTVLTTRPNRLLQEVHDRMPVILESEAAEAWMAQEVPVGEALALAQPLDAESMIGHPVSDRVNWVGNDDAGLIAAVEPKKPPPENLSLF